MHPALGSGHRVDLVDDDPPRGEKRLACLGAEQEEERLGRGNQDLTGCADLPPPVMRAGVTGADVDARNEKRLAECRRDALPTPPLHLGGRGEGAGELVAGGGTEVIQSGLAEFARDGRLLPRVRAT